MDIDQTQDTFAVSMTAAVDGHGDAYTIDFGNIECNITSSMSSSGWIDANIAAPTITLSDTIWANGWNQPSGQLSLKGDDADIDINGVSLMDTIRGIQDRLNMLCPDPEMEAEWDQLRDIREQYEAKLQECREKSRAWKALQQSG
jgi:hypothetical protein